MRQWTDVLLEQRNVVRAALDDQRVGSRAFWFPLHRQAPYQQDGAPFAISSSISDRGLWLPSHFNLTEGDVTRVADVVKSALKRG